MGTARTMNENNERKIILLSEIIEHKVRKEKELEFYQKELDKLQSQMSYLRREINLTNTIINIIEGERVLDLREYVEKKLLEKNDESL